MMLETSSQTNSNANVYSHQVSKTSNNTATKKVIGIFGLSADPPSGRQGHLGIVEYLISTNKFDEIWILPVYSHIYMTKKNLQSYEHRINMCKLNFESLPSDECRLKVSKLEKKLHDQKLSDMKGAASSSECKQQQQERIGTIDLIRYLQDKQPSSSSSSSSKEPDNSTNISDDEHHGDLSRIEDNILLLDIHLILGSDTFNDLMQGKWKESESILNRVKIDVIERVQGAAVNNNNNHCSSSGMKASPIPITIPSQYIDKLNESIFIHSVADTTHSLGDMSSTRIRQVLANRYRHSHKHEDSISAATPAEATLSSSALDEHEKNDDDDDVFLKQALQPNVYQYIIDHHLYCPARTSLSTASTAIETPPN